MDILSRIIKDKEKAKSLYELTYCPKCQIKMSGEIVKSKTSGGRSSGFLKCEKCNYKIII